MITHIANVMQDGDPGTSPILSHFLMSSGEMQPLACQFHTSSGGGTEGHNTDLGGDSGSEGVILVASQGGIMGPVESLSSSTWGSLSGWFLLRLQVTPIRWQNATP